LAESEKFWQLSTRARTHFPYAGCARKKENLEASILCAYNLIMKTILLFIFVSSLFTVLSCAGAAKPASQEAQKSETATASPAAEPVKAETPAPVAAAPAPEAKPVTPPKAEVSKPAEPKEIVWPVKKGKVQGPGARVAAKKISTVKNQKTPGTTSEFCYNYGKFAIVEVVSTDEKGALDIFVRFPSEKIKNLCTADFAGKYVGLDVLEGGFAGVAGDYVVVDGIDSSEGLTEFQIFNLETGKEAYRGAHQPTEEFALTKNGDRTSLVYFSKIKVSCEMVSDPQGCWKKVLADNGIKKWFAAPDCAAAFKKAGTPADELALITVRSRVADLKNPKLELLGGKATCSPAP
jgi:hypothetical protein